MMRMYHECRNISIGVNMETRGRALSNKQRMEGFLRHVGDPGFQTGVGEDIGIHQKYCL